MKKTLLFQLKNLFLLTILCFFITCKKKSNSYVLDISINNSGTVNYESGKYPEGEIIRLEATPEDGYFFLGWHGEGLEAPTDENSINLLMDSNKSITANFISIDDRDYSGTGIWTDSIYSSIDWDLENNFRSIVEAFVKDAQRHGVDVSYALEGEILFGIDNNDFGGKARAPGICRSNKVDVYYNGPIYYLEKNEAIQRKSMTYGMVNGNKVYTGIPSLIKTIWHELGHDILNLDHTCYRGAIMNSCIAIGQKPVSSLLTWYSNDPDLSWRKAVKDLFEGSNQICLKNDWCTLEDICFAEF